MFRLFIRFTLSILVVRLKIVKYFLVEKVKYFLSSLRKVDKSMFVTFERIKELCQKRGISINFLEEQLEISKNYVYSLKNKKTPSAEHISKIADYFNVSTDYLLGRTNNPRIASDKDNNTVDLRKAVAGSMAFDGKPLTEDEINYLADVFEAQLKMKK
ncbi:DNA-binding helix-turn-helix protein [Streptococcus pyogenes ATCC 10782]|nr:DNA-binding helix-turn-helix protein [Streptococcus pyogenes ATCC 10782]